MIWTVEENACNFRLTYPEVRLVDPYRELVYNLAGKDPEKKIQENKNYKLIKKY